MTSLDHLHDFVYKLHPLKVEEWEAFSAIWIEKEYKRKTILTTAGEVEKHLYFVLDGVQRAFYLGKNEEEATIVFTYPHSFSGVPDSFLTRQPSRYFLEALTASRMLRTTYQQMNCL